MSENSQKLIILILTLMVFFCTNNNHAAEESSSERIIVTGTHIKRIDQEGTSPVIRITREEIENSGVSSLSEFLQLIAFNSGGTFNEQLTQGFAPGTSAIDFRGFRPDRTLVMLNGRRMAMYPFGQNGSVAFIDINAIPLSSIERLEILKDGASALYGSDAIAGVLNVITHKGEGNSRINIKGGGTEQGGGEEGIFSLLTNIDEEQFQANVTLEYLFRQEILAGDREYADTLNSAEYGDERSTIGYPGTFLLPTGITQAQGNCPASSVFSTVDGNGNTNTLCRFDWAPKAQLMPETARLGISGAFRYFFEDFELFSRLLFTQIDTTSNGFFTASSSVFFLTPDTPGNPYADNVNYFRLFPELGDPTIETKTNTINFLVGSSGVWGDFDWEVGVNYINSDVDEEYTDGWLDVSGLTALVAQVDAGQLDITQPLSVDVISAITRNYAHDGTSELTLLDFSTSGPILDLDSGPVWLATGVEFRREEFEDVSDPTIINGEVLGLGASAAQGERDAFATYAEIALPVGNQIEISAAMRYDYYDDFGDTLNPKMGIRWTPLDEILIRYSYGTGFKAPNLHELNSAEIIGSNSGIEFVLGGNPDLEAEESESHSLGFIFNPIPDLELSLDFWSIEADNLVSVLGTTTILSNADSDGFFCLLGVNDNGNCTNGARLDVSSDGIINANDIVVLFNADGTVRRIQDKFVNIAGQKTNGVDVGLKLSFNLDVAEILWNNRVVFVNTLETENFPGAGFENFEDSYQFPSLRANSMLTVKTGRVSQALTVNYVGSYDAFDIENIIEQNTGQPTEIDAWVVVDYKLGIEIINGLQASFGVKNVADEDPPVDLGADPSSLWPYYNQSLHNPFGRAYYAELGYQF
ncbi:MAG: TonB-dependent receptor [Pseudomonadota bacterium]